MSIDSCSAPDCGDVRSAAPGRDGPRRGHCSGCRNRIAADLAELPRLYDDCESLLIAAPRALTEKVSGRFVKDAQLNDTAVSVRSDMVAILASWAGLVTAERAVTRPARRDVATLASFVAAHLDWLLAHPAAADFVDEVTTLARAARQAAQPGARIHLELGQCVRPGCESALFATTHGDGGTSLTGHVRCESGHVWKAHQWLPLADRLAKTRRPAAGSAHES
ncbi:hypothetical protein [Amycolatopsis australiensis]|uniref:Uncharacterized protein n=1 Tax=Amycolatopsis australiensis TaxID=546364 RepID=A0A1K1S2R3_9PSEU|nr:hypothetical protein [Amycolatopsis australiensis]SFW78349.1 hypothetical protein SAMN04489730_4503 [Amycolatopsis australiensis]